MKASDVRTWLGVYFLLITVLLGGYILLFGETQLLPISKQEALDAFEIIIPVLVGQLAIIFQWFANPPDTDREARIKIAPWIVKAPPLLVAFLLILTIAMMVLGNRGAGADWAPSPAAFKGIVTFSLSILNATTFIIVARYFHAAKT